ncbi:MAG: squalene/phytoene synthase family protein, partial [Xanthomonadaceae bacterium]|nr:squalene/phytoene synthase family protein [Xanthomonadaceae bacterium]
MSTESTLDASLVNRAAPPGSMRYFALLYTPEDRRDALTALFVIDAEIREAADSANHEVAHTRLRWWRDEVDRLVNAGAQHPATQALERHHRGSRESFAKLHELLVAADMDLARMTYANASELRAYLARSGGTLAELIAAELASPDTSNDAVRSAANAIGIGIRQAEIVRDVRQDVHDGRLYFPLEELDEHAVQTEQLSKGEINAGAKRILARMKQDAQAALAPRLPDDGTHEALRPLRVLAALHGRLLERIAARHYEVGKERIELGPLEKPWTAWREARRSRS